MVDWAHDVLLNQRNALPHLQRIIVRLRENYYGGLWEEDEKLLRENVGMKAFGWIL